MKKTLLCLPVCFSLIACSTSSFDPANYQNDPVAYVYNACLAGYYHQDITYESCQEFMQALGQVNPQYNGMGMSDFQTMSDISAQMHNTNMSILNNIGGGDDCTLGVDPNCVPF